MLDERFPGNRVLDVFTAVFNETSLITSGARNTNKHGPSDTAELVCRSHDELAEARHMLPTMRMPSLIRLIVCIQNSECINLATIRGLTL
jgi:TnpA family transposase